MSKNAIKAVMGIYIALILGLTGCGGGGGSNGPSAGSNSSDKTAPSVPTGLTAIAASSNSITCTWSASTDDVSVTGYKVFRNGTHIETILTTSYTDSVLTSNTTYTYTVAAFDAAGNNSSLSSSTSATTFANGVTDTVAPTAPTNLTAVAVSSGQINLSWTASSDNVGVAGYEVYRGTTIVSTATGTSYSDAGLSENTNYTQPGRAGTN